MMLPDPAQNKRHLAEHARHSSSRLAAARSLGNVIAATVSRCPVLAVAHQTPSPLGQYGTTRFLLPHFSGTGIRAGTGKKNDTNAELVPPFRVGLVTKSFEGRQKCPSRKHSSPCASVAALRPAVTHWVNRPSAAPQSVPVQQQSPVAALQKVRPSGPQATSPTASSTPTSVTDLTSPAAAQAVRPARSHNPAQQMLRRGFRVYPTLKRIPNVQ